jgi:redox-sensitive bicupin YhaK (pirin superfamily)
MLVGNIRPGGSMIVIRPPESIFNVDGRIERGTFHGRWHFSFDMYRDQKYMHFGPLRVFNDDTLSPGAVWPLHPHREIEVVTYCAGGEFRHEDEHGKGGILRQGWAQHTTVGTGMFHSEINNRPDEPMRFIQLWFYPDRPGRAPSVEQRRVEREERTNRLLCLVAPADAGCPDALPIHADGRVASCFLEQGKSVVHPLGPGRGAYLYVLEGGPVLVGGKDLPALGAAKIEDDAEVRVEARGDAELLLVDVGLDVRTDIRG